MVLPQYRVLIGEVWVSVVREFYSVYRGGEVLFLLSETVILEFNLRGWERKVFPMPLWLFFTVIPIEFKVWVTV